MKFAPQIIWLSLAILGLGIELSKHGEPKTGKHNFVADVVASAILVGLLYWGGFFDELLQRIY